MRNVFDKRNAFHFHHFYIVQQGNLLQFSLSVTVTALHFYVTSLFYLHHHL